MAVELIVRSGDARLLRVVDSALAEARQRAGDRLVCRAGCSSCCVGPFPISALDAWRLRDGLRQLALADPDRAAAVSARADAAVEMMRRAFPGGAADGRFEADEAAAAAFRDAFAHLPCPALDPDTGGCDLYPARPLSCRTFGPPVRLEGELLPPCGLCFVGASAVEIHAAAVPVDVAALEYPLLDLLEPHRAGDTIVAFALRSLR